jgi:hypothetical protein
MDSVNPLGFHCIHESVVGGVPNSAIEVTPFAPDLLLGQDTFAEACQITYQLAVVSEICWIVYVAHSGGPGATHAFEHQQLLTASRVSGYRRGRCIG